METSRTDPAVRKETTVAEREPLHRLAVKTNLLYDAVLMPSLEVEYRIDDRWSVNLEGDVAWWKNDGRHRYYQLATVSPEGRYWFRDPETLARALRRRCSADSRGTIWRTGPGLSG